MTRTARILAGALLAVAVIGAAQPVLACPVCWGASDEPMAQGMNNGIFFLLGVIGMVQIGFVALFVSFRNRARDYQERKDAFEVINGGSR